MFCKYCGEKIPSTSTTCPSCGKRLKDGSSPMPQVQMVGVQVEKNLGLGLALAFLLGPLGLLYSSVRWACILIAINVILLTVSCGSIFGSVASRTSDTTAAMFGSLLFWIVIIVSWIGSIVLAWYSIQEYNTNVRKGIANSDVN